MPKKDANPIDRHVGTRIRMQRIVRGLSQTELGEAVGLTFSRCRNTRSARIGIAPAGCNKSPTSKGCARFCFFEEAHTKKAGNSAATRDNPH